MCTTLIITKGAMADGSMVVTHSDDDELGDQTLIRVPAQDHAPGATRDILREHYLHPRMSAVPGINQRRARSPRGPCRSGVLPNLRTPTRTSTAITQS